MFIFFPCGISPKYLSPLCLLNWLCYIKHISLKRYVSYKENKVELLENLIGVFCLPGVESNYIFIYCFKHVGLYFCYSISGFLVFSSLFKNKTKLNKTYSCPSFDYTGGYLSIYQIQYLSHIIKFKKWNCIFSSFLVWQENVYTLLSCLLPDTLQSLEV